VAMAVTSGGTRGVPVPFGAHHMNLRGAIKSLEQDNLVNVHSFDTTTLRSHLEPEFELTDER
jgi:hypothetical protein